MTDPGAKIIHLHKVQPGDLISVVSQLRRYMACADTTGKTIYASFAEIGEDVDENAEKARRHVEATAARLRTLIASIEKTPAYLAARKKKLDAEPDEVNVERLYDPMTIMSDDGEDKS